MVIHIGGPIKRASQLFGFLHEIHVDLNEENDLKLRYPIVPLW